MSNREMLQEIISDEFFGQTISLVVKTVTYVKGTATTTSASPAPIEAIVQVVKEKELMNLGLGLYTDKENYSVFTATEIDQSKNNYITYQGKTFKIVKALPWRGYGFRKYIMSQYNDGVLNDN